MEHLFNRISRVSQELRKKIANIIHNSLQDPRIDILTTVSEVQVSRDFSHAKVFVTFSVTKNKNQILSMIKTLQNASGYIRFMLKKVIKLRIIPNIIFIHDNSYVQGIKISNLIDKTLKPKIEM